MPTDEEAKLTRPIIGIENRTPQEAFDIMCDRIRSALTGASAVGEADWRDDPSADERWSAGLDYGMTQLCVVLGVNSQEVDWDAATETLDGDVQSVVGKILTKWGGDDWHKAAPVQPGDGLAGARDAFLDLIADAIEWKEEPDGDMDSDGRMIDCTTYHLITSYRQIDELVDALKIDRRYDETSGQAIARAIAAPTKGGE